MVRAPLNALTSADVLLLSPPAVMARQGRVTVLRHVTEDDISPPAYTAAVAQAAVAQAALAQPSAAHGSQPWRRDNWPYADTLVSRDQLENSTRAPAGHPSASTGKPVTPTKQSWLRRCCEVLLDTGTGIACLLACLVMVPLALVANVIIAVVSTIVGIVCRPFLMCYMRCAD